MLCRLAVAGVLCSGAVSRDIDEDDALTSMYAAAEEGSFVEEAEDENEVEEDESEVEEEVKEEDEEDDEQDGDEEEQVDEEGHPHVHLFKAIKAAISNGSNASALLEDED